MNDIRRLQYAIIDAFPDARINLAHPYGEACTWWMHIYRGEFCLLVEWRDGDGFDLTVLDPDKFDNAYDEVYLDYQAALGRCTNLLTPKEPIVVRRADDEAFQAALARTIANHAGTLKRLAEAEKAECVQCHGRGVIWDGTDDYCCEGLSLCTGCRPCPRCRPAD